jgi:hypothetical protein
VEENKGEASGGNEATSVRRVGRLKHSITVRNKSPNYLLYIDSAVILQTDIFLARQSRFTI